MNRVKKFALLSFLLINVAVLALDYFQVKEFIRTLSDNNEYIAYLYSQLLFFPQPFLSEMVDACFFGTGDRVRPKESVRSDRFYQVYCCRYGSFWGDCRSDFGFRKRKYHCFPKQRDYGYRNRGNAFFALFNPRLPNPILSARLCQKQNRCSDCFVPDADPTGLWLRQGDFSVSS